MQLSNIVIYKNCKIVPEKNMKVDDITGYLSTFSNANKWERDDMNYVKHGLDITIRIPFNTDNGNQNLGWEAFVKKANYVSITNENEPTYYYFITSVNIIANNTVELVLSIDSINTFDWASNLDDRTSIIREHRDRMFKRNTDNTIWRRIDPEPEGLNGIVKYKSKETEINRRNSIKWYLMYKSDSTDANSPVRCYAITDGSVQLYDYIRTRTIDFNTFKQLTNDNRYTGMYIDNRGFSGCKVTVGGTEYDISNCIAVICYYNYNQGLYRMYKSTDNLQTYTDMFGYTNQTLVIDGCRGYYVAATNYTSDVPTAYPIKSTDIFAHQVFNPWGTDCVRLSQVDRTDSRLIKIIELPYAPFNMDFDNDDNLIIPTGWRLYNNMIEYEGDVDICSTVKPTALFDNMQIDTDEIIGQTTRYDYFESKMLNSEVSTLKYTYDSFSKEVKRELLESVRDTYNIKYYQSSNISSKLMFEINADFKEEDDYGKYLICNRNNEVPIYTSAYLNYIRTGYNYDIKNKHNQDTANWVSTGIQIVGAVGSFVASSFTGGLSLVAGVSLATSAAGSISSNIASSISSTNQIEQKLQEARNQAVSVSQADDLSLLNIYNGNKLYEMEYTPSANMCNKIADLFYYCGYATQKQGTPELNTRRYFNYIQCEPVFKDEFITNNYVQDITARLAKGVTVYHKYNNTYDFEQIMENYEVWINN